jgi:hypothetical protein
MTANSLKLMPFLISNSTTISDLGCRITAAASGGFLRLGIYASGTNNLPTGNPKAVTIDISTTSTGSISQDITGADVPLQAGLYWMAVILDATASATTTLQTLASATINHGYVIGSTTLANVTQSSTNAALSLSFDNTGAYGTWPDLTSASFVESTSQANGLVYYKVI